MISIYYESEFFNPAHGYQRRRDQRHLLGVFTSRLNHRTDLVWLSPLRVMRLASNDAADLTQQN